MIILGVHAKFNMTFTKACKFIRTERGKNTVLKMDFNLEETISNKT